MEDEEAGTKTSCQEEEGVNVSVIPLPSWPVPRGGRQALHLQWRGRRVSALTHQPWLSPNISCPLMKTHLAPRPLPSAVPRTVLGRDLLHGRFGWQWLRLPCTSASSSGLIRCTGHLQSICVLTVPISLHYPQAGVWNE